MTGEEFDKTQPKFDILKFLPDEGVNRPVEKYFRPKDSGPAVGPACCGTVGGI